MSAAVLDRSPIRTTRTKDDHLSDALDVWCRWMRWKQLPKGMPHASSGGIQGYSTVDWDMDNVYAELDENLARHVDAAVTGLVPAQRCAVYYVHHLSYVWRFNRSPVKEVYASARPRLVVALTRRGVWLGDA